MSGFPFTADEAADSAFLEQRSPCQILRWMPCSFIRKSAKTDVGWCGQIPLCHVFRPSLSFFLIYNTLTVLFNIRFPLCPRCRKRLQPVRRFLFPLQFCRFFCSFCKIPRIFRQGAKTPRSSTLGYSGAARNKGGMPLRLYQNVKSCITVRQVGGEMYLGMSPDRRGMVRELVRSTPTATQS